MHYCPDCNEYYEHHEIKPDIQVYDQKHEETFWWCPECGGSMEYKEAKE